MYTQKGFRKVKELDMEYEKIRKTCKEISRHLKHPEDRRMFKKKSAEMLYEVSVDSATGLKKFSYVRYLYEIVKPRIKRGKDVSVLFIDIDNFKGVNENHSYEEADSLLNHTGEILNKALLERAADIVSEQTRRESRRENGKGIIKDIVARYHEKGDELLVILYGTDKEGAKTVADRIVNYVKNDSLFKHYGSGLTIGISSRNGCSELEHIIKNAEKALKYGKKNGKNSYHVDVEVLPVEVLTV